MRYKEPFTLYQRKLSSEKKVWYYRTYDENNNRVCESTPVRLLRLQRGRSAMSYIKQTSLFRKKELK